MNEVAAITDIPTGFSIVLCTYNGKSRLQATMAHLAALQIPTHHAIELLIVDNASTDGTAPFAKSVWNELNAPFTLRLLTENRSGKGYAIETGYDAAFYSYILTVDDDNWLCSDYLERATEILNLDAEIGILQGLSEGAFESPVPDWAEKMKQCFVIGSPVQMPGYFPEKNFYVWGAGMVIKKNGWADLRKRGFAFLTSKIPGKAAGEDNETALGFLLLGKKIYYSDKLKYKHYMPKDRINWDKLKLTFEMWGYMNHFFFLYALVLDSYEKKYTITDNMIKKKFFNHMVIKSKSFTLKQHLAYWLKPQHDLYQLRLDYYYSLGKWFLKLNKTALRDISFLQSWMFPLLKENRSFEWQGGI